MRHSAWLAAALVTLLVGCAELAPARPTAKSAGTAPSPEGRLLTTDDAAARNAELVAAKLRVPSGSGPAERAVNLPNGFSVTLLAAGLRKPRFMAFDEAGGLLVADQSGSVYRYAAENGRIAPRESPPEPLLRGLDAPSSLALQGGYLYVGETSRISRFKYASGGAAGPAEVVVPELPVGGHNTRTVAFGPDGKLYVAVGSSCNICQERDERRAAVLRYGADGTGYERFAWGLRNPVGLAFQPGTGALWATVNERDNQGDEIPNDLVTAVKQGSDYGWPSCMPPDGKTAPEGSCAQVTPATVGIQAHSAPLGIAFYAGTRFPETYRGDAFVVQHGSWNRQPPAAPKLLRIDFDAGRPVKVTDFATGWQEGNSSVRWGRPAGVVSAPDGSLVVSDDQAGLLYRISFGEG